MPPLIVTVVIGFVGACVLTDVRSRRIPNLLSLAGATAGIVLNAAYFGTTGLVASVCGSALAIGLLLAPFALGGIGGGDVKMLGAVGALLGPRLVLLALGGGLTVGGVAMAVHLARRGRLGETLLRTAVLAHAAAAAHSLDPLRVSAAAPGAVALPYSVPLAIGTLAATLVGIGGLS
ncbi:MAG: A24 family peptidase [Candidatus Binatia bacterium]